MKQLLQSIFFFLCYNNSLFKSHDVTWFRKTLKQGSWSRTRSQQDNTAKQSVLPGKVAGLDDHRGWRTWQLLALSSLAVLSSACPLQAFVSEAYAFFKTQFTVSPLKKSLCKEAVSQNKKENSGYGKFSSILILAKDAPFYQQPQGRECKPAFIFISSVFQKNTSVFLLLHDFLNYVGTHYLLNIHW